MSMPNIWDELAEAFPDDVVELKPQKVTGNRCLAVHYIDARAVMDRLDQVVGPMNWQDSYDVLQDGCVRCTLKIRLPGGDEWITKQDVGGQSEQDDLGDKMKAAFSDALKRAAVKFGIGRYLYSLPIQWMDYDPQKRQIIRPGQREVPGKATIVTQEKKRPQERVEFLADSPTMLSAIKEKLKAAGHNDWGVLLRKFEYQSMKEVPVSKYKDIMNFIESLGVPA